MSYNYSGAYGLNSACIKKSRATRTINLSNIKEMQEELRLS